MSSNLIANSKITVTNFVEEGTTNLSLEKPYEIELYEEVQVKSHYNSLIDELKFKLSSNLRNEYEQYVSDRAIHSGHKLSLFNNLCPASDLTVANLL